MDQHEPPAKSALPQGSKTPYETSMEARIAVLEQIAKDTKEILTEMKLDMREMRGDARTDFRLLFGAIITVALGLSGLLAHGFRWF